MREGLLFKLHLFQPLLMVLQARPVLGAGDTQKMNQFRPQWLLVVQLEGVIKVSGGEGSEPQTGENWST